MEKSKFDVRRELSLGEFSLSDDLKVPTYEALEASMLKEDGMSVKPSYNEKGELLCVDYQDTLSSKEALKKTPVTGIRYVSGHTQVVPGKAFIRTMKGRCAKDILGHKFWEWKSVDRYWEYIFDDKKRLTETYGIIEGRKTFEYDEQGRLSKINDFGYNGKNAGPVATLDIAYDEQGRFSKITKERARFGNYKFRDGEKVKRSISLAYDAEGGYVATVRSSIDGYLSNNYFEYHCNKEDDIQMKIEKDNDNNIIKKENYVATKSNAAVNISGGIEL